MFLFELLAAAPLPSPTPTLSPDLRTAIATEQLVKATYALVSIGLATLISAVVAAGGAVAAAIFTWRVYALESVPALAITSGRPPPGAPEEPPHLLAVTRDGNEPVASVKEVALTLVPRSEISLTGLFPRIRNVGRSPVVEANLKVRVTVSGPMQCTGTGALRVASILPGETAYVPIVATILCTGWTIEVIDADALKPGFGEASRRKKRLRFMTAKTFVPPS